ncbi:hypothetical protein [Synechococcus sp. MIT S9508]|nr:hypothetical protein [Synechococcus sp. MIT S9508]
MPRLLTWAAACGSSRWAGFVAPRLGRLHCINPSSALDVGR